MCDARLEREEKAMKFTQYALILGAASRIIARNKKQSMVKSIHALRPASVVLALIQRGCRLSAMGRVTAKDLELLNIFNAVKESPHANSEDLAFARDAVSMVIQHKLLSRSNKEKAYNILSSLAECLGTTSLKLIGAI